MPSLDIADLIQKLKDQTGDRAEDFDLDVKFVKRCIIARSVRGEFFPAHLFADPAWDILLDLTLARLQGRKVSVSSLAIAANVPTTTALRWIAGMTEAGMLVRQADPSDSRRSYLSLSNEVYATMARCLGLMRAKLER